MRAPGLTSVAGILRKASSDHVRADGVLPSVEQAATAALKSAPTGVRRFIHNALAIVSWIGLPATIISTLSGLQWVIDAAVWLYRHAGALQPVLDAIGQGIVALVALWRGITHPVWTALADWIGLALPAWAPDLLTLLALGLTGLLRRTLRAAWGGHIAGSLMMRAVDRTRAPHATYARMPRRFPYRDHFAASGIRWTGHKLADAERLWRKWRAEQIRMFLAMDGSHWPLVREEVTRAQFGRFWLAVMDARRAALTYNVAALIVLGAIAIDACLRLRSGA